jgi:hypothetical protein
VNGNYRSAVNWHQHFADVLVSGDAGKVAAAAALDAERCGASRKDAAEQFRDSQPGRLASGTGEQTAGRPRRRWPRGPGN